MCCVTTRGPCWSFFLKIFIKNDKHGEMLALVNITSMTRVVIELDSVLKHIRASRKTETQIALASPLDGTETH